MTFHSPIIAASPLALATTFNAPFVSCSQDSAIVTVRKALGELPQGVCESTLDELVAPACDLLVQRDATLTELNEIAGRDNDQTLREKALWDRLTSLESQILQLPPTFENVFSKFVLLARISVEGSEVEEEVYRSVLKETEEAFQTTGAGAGGGRQIIAFETQTNFVRPAFARRLARHQLLSAAAEAFEVDVVAPARERFLALQDRIPHTTTVLGTGLAGQTVIATTAEAYQVRMARGAVEKPFSCPEYQAGMLKIAEAADNRDAEIEKAAEASGLTAARRKSDRLDALVIDSEWSFIRMPVASTAELRLKISFMIERRLFDSADAAEDAFGVLLTDAQALGRRFAPSNALASDPVPDCTLVEGLVH